jgi:hypothetical protein
LFFALGGHIPRVILAFLHDVLGLSWLVEPASKEKGEKKKEKKTGGRKQEQPASKTT